MTEHSAPLQPTDQAGHPNLEQPDRSAVVTLNLPSDLALAIEEQRQQSGQPTIEVIVNLLRSALKLPDTPRGSAQTACEMAKTSTPEGLEAILERLAQVEALIPRLETLEGKSIAF